VFDNEGEVDQSYENQDDSASRHCTDCDFLIDALRDQEQQCREAEEERTKGAMSPSYKSCEPLRHEEELYIAKKKKLEYRRNCASEVLLNQRLEH